MSEQAPQQIKLSYPECSKGGYHTGELMNFVNLEHKNQDEILFCSACLEQNPQVKNIKPLKIILNDVRDRISLIKSQPINPEELLLIVTSAQSAMTGEFKEITAQWNDKLKQIEEGYDVFFSRIKEQIKIRGASSEEMSAILSKFSQKSLELEDMKSSIARLLVVGPNSQDSEILETETIQNNIMSCTKDLREDLLKQHNQINESLGDQLKILEDIKRDAGIWRDQMLQTSFSPILQHPNVVLTNPNSAKSGGIGNVYKIALLDCPLSGKGVTKQIRFSFKVKEIHTQNWISLGACYKGIVSSKGYGFNIGSIGHGAYMISSNGSTWSNHLITANNKLASFKFGQNDVIWGEFDQTTQTITYGKQGAKDTYSLAVNLIETDVLYPCVCFFFFGDQVENVTK